MLRCSRLSHHIPRPCVRQFNTASAKQLASPVDGPPIFFTSRHVPSWARPNQSRRGDHADKRSVLHQGQNVKSSALYQDHKQASRNERSEDSSSKARQIKDNRACTVLTSSPADTSLQQLLDRIPTLQADSVKPDFALLVLLITPSYASSLRSQQNVIDQAVNRIYPSADSLKHGLHVLAAVVDRLPNPSSPDGDIGSEGIAFIFTDNVDDAPQLKSQAESSDAPSRDLASANQVRRSITFSLPSDQPVSHSVQMPLANTVFQNGLPSTLIHSQYMSDSGSLIKQSSRMLDHQTINLPFVSTSKTDLSLDAPLVPLTPARSVVACMGNIIRRLSSNTFISSTPPNNDTILASHELEHSVTSFFKARHLPPQAVSVWALIVPQEHFSGNWPSVSDVLQPQNLVDRWKNTSSNWIQSSAHTPLTLVQHNARLHKVLSGGGGWGKKAGLLSLDPESTYNVATVQEPSFLSDLGFELEQEDSALRNIVNPGDYIQFYISPGAPPANSSQHPPTSVQIESSTAEFGTIPSTVDTMPSPQQGAGTTNSTIEVFHNHFGALSEIGMALTISGPDQVNQTKMDVPFGRFRFRSATPQSAKVGQAFTPTKPLSSIMSFHASRPKYQYRKHTDELINQRIPQRRLLHIKRVLVGEKTTSNEYRHHQENDTIWQSGSPKAMTARDLKKITRVPQRPNKNWLSKDINQARKILRVERAEKDEQAKEAEEARRIEETRKAEGASQRLLSRVPEVKNDTTTSKLGDLLSPNALQHWIQVRKIPNHPTDSWTSKDIRQAKKYFGKKRKGNSQGKSSETHTHFVTLNRQEATEPTPLQEGLKETKPPNHTSAKPRTEITEATENPAITALKQQAYNRLKSRILTTAFKDLLPDSSTRRRHHRAPLQPSYTASDSAFTRRVISLLTIRETCPRITVNMLVDPTRRVKVKKFVGRDSERDFKEMEKERLRGDLEVWRGLAEEMRKEVGGSGGQEGERLGRELKRIEESVRGFLI